MIPTFSVNLKAKEICDASILEVVKVKPFNVCSSSDLDKFTGFILKKSDGLISEGRSVNSYLYNYDRDEKNAIKVDFFSDLDSKTQNYIDSIASYDDFESSLFDEEELKEAKEVYLEYCDFCFIHYGLDLMRLLHLCLEQDAVALDKLKVLMGSLKTDTRYCRYSYEDLKYSLGLLVLDSSSVEKIKEENLG